MYDSPFDMSGGHASKHLRCLLAVRREDICRLSWVIDSYDGMGFLVTDNSKRGLVSVLLSSDYREELEALLDALESEGMVMKRLGVQEQ